MLLVGARKDVFTPRSGDEVEVGNRRRPQGRLDAPAARSAYGPGGKAGMQVGVVGRFEAVVLLVELWLPASGGQLDRVLHCGVGLERHAEPKPVAVDRGYQGPVGVDRRLPL